MSETAVLPPQEQLPVPDQQAETIDLPPIDEAPFAAQATAKHVRKLEGKISKLEQKQTVQDAIGEMAVSVASGKKSKDGTLVVAKSFFQRRKAAKAYKKAEAISHKRGVDQLRFNVYGSNDGSNRSLIKTALLRYDLNKEANRKLADGSVDMAEYKKLKDLAKTSDAYKAEVVQDDLDIRQEQRISKLQSKLSQPIRSEIRQSRIRSSQAKLDKLNGMGPYDKLTNLLFPNAKSESELANQDAQSNERPETPAVVVPEPTPTPPTKTSTPEAKPKKSSIERLLKMKADGLLPEAPETPTVTEEVSAAPDDAETKSSEEVEPTPAEKPKDGELDQASVERMAELAYVTAKERVYELVDEEEEKRKASGKPQLTKEEIADFWKRERGIRQQLLGKLSPDNRTLVNKQIGEIIGADKKARAEGKEQLLQKHRREAREKEAAERKAAAQKKADEKSAKDAEDAKQKAAAAAVYRNAAQTAIDS